MTALSPHSTPHHTRWGAKTGLKIPLYSGLPCIGVLPIQRFINDPNEKGFLCSRNLQARHADSVRHVRNQSTRTRGEFALRINFGPRLDFLVGFRSVRRNRLASSKPPMMRRDLPGFMTSPIVAETSQGGVRGNVLARQEAQSFPKSER